ncbi:hypothetical protein TBR22_A20730 [Luteitalea sp. TBR-22]|uniref:hypothetical protein n=1 Tax=Luteitalea sp. TBR-22 TaxID=2802971 RepID=UPI001AFB2ECF|nr:hypothetical protein [Luteitalea sp. TBR-22]BCS32849.1 hypothetical protein TBR22_A20730 [Luteitalea sp. TBR-22]
MKGKAGLFPELKGPGRLRAKGLSLEDAVVAALTHNGLTEASVQGRPVVWRQSLEEESLQVLAARRPAVPRTFLLGNDEAARRWVTADGLRRAIETDRVDGLFTDNPDLFPRSRPYGQGRRLQLPTPVQDAPRVTAAGGEGDWAGRCSSARRSPGRGPTTAPSGP